MGRAGKRKQQREAYRKAVEMYSRGIDVLTPLLAEGGGEGEGGGDAGERGKGGEGGEGEVQTGVKAGEEGRTSAGVREEASGLSGRTEPGDGSGGRDRKTGEDAPSGSSPQSVRAVLSVLLSNRAQANLLLGNHGRMLDDAKAAVRLDAGNVKVSSSYTQFSYRFPHSTSWCLQAYIIAFKAIAHVATWAWSSSSDVKS